MTTSSVRRRSTGTVLGVAAAAGLLVLLTGLPGRAQPADPSSGSPTEVVATPWIRGILGAPAEGAPPPVPEGPAFTPDGDLVFVSAFGDAEGNKVYEVDLDTKQVRPLYGDDTSVIASLDVAADGRFYLSDYNGGPGGSGRILTMAPDGTDVRTLIDAFEGTPIYPDDLVMDGDGGFFYTDMQGNVLEPTGRVVHVDASGAQTLVSGGLAHPNGIALSPDGSRLWVSEHLANRLLTFDLDESGVAVDEWAPGTGVSVYAHYSGGLADSLTVDAAGNVYQAMYFGGRVEVFDSSGNPVATVRPEGNGPEQFPTTTNVAIRPGTREAYLTAGGPEGISILRFTALADALPPVWEG
ncbi:SMP-30/gluconolactonase/LRE family protein [Geodermatophilus sp. TF02-6]|uniref:SMP-30/gluconolactonase/LRE family protein n=1 Tax=Geodermatophilus sp. TF02-6 TaxID=2250575 RepID=UPI000DE972A5|nr:SMP-30/gluconolactonase/LRE family protein [Geodermatophilus sp. TF02-6]RBY83657.1 SMP-30/gluconolactonase/LRE family protein [Geodermatophilus sp. TF02-6]